MSLLFLFHFFIVFFLPKPINTINIFFIFFILFIIGWEKSVIVWLAWLVFYVFELYAVTPLGFIIVPGVLSVIVVYLLYINVFTNRSWFTGAALSAIAILINRLAYLALVYTLNYSSGISKIVLRNFFTDLFWEITLTSAATGLLFFLLSKKINRFGRDKVQMIF
ncbi:MAG: hypothetical protein A2301_00010 [Candidatus Magasanikbacteria bacterium RIFOXYB2_FULL_40_13]|nr:MAG: hypothetical protein A2224_01575 [Candidatus Magasanikbacteria bacterium RIFOXYA2_FULL_40_20]OGH86336.1 MAG: hypothetical protein A2301_00010 [Candidatus Magasanikbacteria bacterium RIFOXYB2_FULL_40_13]